MKKILTIASALVLCAGFTACSDDDEPVAPTQLPEAAKTFIAQYFPGTDVVRTEKDGKGDKTEYSVTISNGYELEFDAVGAWTDVDAPAGQTIPEGIAPEPIVNFIAVNYSATGINEISRDYRYYEVELVNKIDLTFLLDGTFVDADY